MGNTEGFSTASFVEAHRILLTREEEIELFSKWRNAKGALAERYLTDIVKAYSPIIKATIREFSGYREDPEELTSEGLYAIVQAAHRFDMESGFRFSTYAKSWVRGVMLGFITKNYFPVNICTSHAKKKLFFAIRRRIAYELKTNGNYEMSMTEANEFAKEFELTPEDVIALYEMIRKPPVSLADPVHNEDGSMTRLDFVKDSSPNTDELFSEEFRHEFHRRIILEVANHVLAPREHAIFLSQTLADKDHVKTLETLGEEFDISKERVRQIRNQAVDKVKAEIQTQIKSLGLDINDIL